MITEMVWTSSIDEALSKRGVANHTKVGVGKDRRSSGVEVL